MEDDRELMQKLNPTIQQKNRGSGDEVMKFDKDPEQDEVVDPTNIFHQFWIVT